MRRRGPTREQRRDKEFHLKYHQCLKKLDGIPQRLGEKNELPVYMSLKKFTQLVEMIDARLPTASPEESPALLQDKEFLTSQLKWMRLFSGPLEEELSRLK